MRKVLKWLGIIVGVLLLVILIAGIVLYFVGRNKLDETHEYDTQALTLPTDQASLDRGQHLADAVSLCTDCHGRDLGGDDDLFGSPVIGKITAPNLTTGRGGVGASYTPEDWVRALRHGVDQDGKPLLGMPSQWISHYSDADLAAILAYVQSVPPVDREVDELELAPVGYIMVGAGMFGDIPVEAIDHDAQPSAPEIGVTAEYGEYLVNVASCKDCHGKDLNGGPSMGPPPGPDLTRSGDLGDWDETGFINTIRNGVTPDGDTLNRDEMPWDRYTLMTDDELKAIWSYLQTLD